EVSRVRTVVVFIVISVACSFAATCEQANIPPRVEVKELEDGVCRFDVRWTNTNPSFFRQLLDLFGLTPAGSLPFHRSVAFLVGVSSYKFLEPQLSYVKSDLLEMRNFLLTDGGFDTVF